MDLRISSSEEEANQFDSYITLLVNEGEESFDETNFDRHNLILILKHFIKLLQHNMKENTILREERQEIEKEIREKFEENK